MITEQTDKNVQMQEALCLYEPPKGPSTPGCPPDCNQGMVPCRCEDHEDDEYDEDDWASDPQCGYDCVRCRDEEQVPCPVCGAQKRCESQVRLAQAALQQAQAAVQQAQAELDSAHRALAQLYLKGITKAEEKGLK